MFRNPFACGRGRSARLGAKFSRFRHGPGNSPGVGFDMAPERKDRRRYGRGGLFSQIEDATYRVLRKAGQDALRQAANSLYPLRGAEDNSPDSGKGLVSENVAA